MYQRRSHASFWVSTKILPHLFNGKKKTWSGWWFFTNPFEKICASQIGSFFPQVSRGENNKIFELPPTGCFSSFNPHPLPSPSLGGGIASRFHRCKPRNSGYRNFFPRNQRPMKNTRWAPASYKWSYNPL